MVENPIVVAPPPAMNWPLRLAQQAFASVLDHREKVGSFAVASRRQAARYSLPALSLDDRVSLERWLVLQLMTITVDGAHDALAALRSIDTLLAAAVRVQVVRTDPDRFTASQALDRGPVLAPLSSLLNWHRNVNEFGAGPRGLRRLAAHTDQPLPEARHPRRVSSDHDVTSSRTVASSGCDNAP